MTHKDLEEFERSFKVNRKIRVGVKKMLDEEAVAAIMNSFDDAEMSSIYGNVPEIATVEETKRNAKGVLCTRKTRALCIPLFYNAEEDLSKNVRIYRVK